MSRQEEKCPICGQPFSNMADHLKQHGVTDPLLSKWLLKMDERIKALEATDNLR